MFAVKQNDSKAKTSSNINQQHASLTCLYQIYICCQLTIFARNSNAACSFCRLFLQCYKFSFGLKAVRLDTLVVDATVDVIATEQDAIALSGSASVTLEDMEKDVTKVNRYKFIDCTTICLIN